MEFAEAYFPEPHVEIFIILHWIKLVTVTCSKTCLQIKRERPTSRKREKSRPRKKSSFWNAENFGKRREDPLQIRRMLTIFFSLKEQAKKGKQTNKVNSNKLKEEKIEQKSPYADSRYAVTLFPVTPLRVLLTTQRLLKWHSAYKSLMNTTAGQSIKSKTIFSGKL